MSRRADPAWRDIGSGADPVDLEDAEMPGLSRLMGQATGSVTWPTAGFASQTQ